MTGAGAKAARDRLFVALDMADVGLARRLVETLGNSVTAYKLGL
jgi:orotidine-5'-phosphate decarboxylase